MRRPDAIWFKRLETVAMEIFLIIFPCWWLVKVTLEVAFDFLPQNFERWQGPMNDDFAQKWMQLDRWGQSQVVGTLKPYLMF